MVKSKLKYGCSPGKYKENFNVMEKESIYIYVELRWLRNKLCILHSASWRPKHPRKTQLYIFSIKSVLPHPPVHKVSPGLLSKKFSLSGDL